MTDIIIHKKDDVHAYVECSRGLAEELSDFFSFYVPGYKFMPKFKSKQWSGKIHLFRSMDRTIYIGLKDYIVEFAKDRDYSVSVDDDVMPYDSRIDDKMINHFIDSMNVHSGGKKIDPYDYQRATISHALKKKRSLILSPTGSGKSLCIYALTRFLQNITNKKILILVPTTGLVLQMYSDFEDYSSEDEWDVKENCHQIMGGRDKNSDKQIFISTWQSIHRLPESWYKPFNATLADECLAGDTKIDMYDGSTKTIDFVDVGDIVKTYNEETKEIEDKKVTKKYKNLQKSSKEKMYRLYFDNGTFIEVTGNHKILTDSGWVRADMLSEKHKCINRTCEMNLRNK